MILKIWSLNSETGRRRRRRRMRRRRRRRFVVPRPGTTLSHLVKIAVQAALIYGVHYHVKYRYIYIDIVCPKIDIEYENFGYRTCSVTIQSEKNYAKKHNLVNMIRKQLLKLEELRKTNSEHSEHKKRQIVEMVRDEASEKLKEMVKVDLQIQKLLFPKNFVAKVELFTEPLEGSRAAAVDEGHSKSKVNEHRLKIEYDHHDNIFSRGPSKES
jgi:hypothetical protein